MSKMPDPHTAPEEPHPLTKSLWRRWLAWNGSFFILSLLLHLLLIGMAMLLVIQVVQKRDKLKFTAPPPSPEGPKSVEHQVKAAKKSASMSVPSVSKRITTTAANASVALPPMEMSSSMPDIMSSVMSGLGNSGLGSGAGTGSGGLSSLPSGGLTAFGFKGGGSGLKGTFYDLKQLSDRKPSEVVIGRAKQQIQKHLKVLENFFQHGWNDDFLSSYHQANDTLVAPQIFMPSMKSEEATKAFGVDKETQGLHWVVLYKGTVIAPRDGTFRFLGWADDMIAVRFDNQDVFAKAIPQPLVPEMFEKVFHDLYALPPEDLGKYLNVDLGKGKWFQVKAGQTYPMEVLISEAYGGLSAYLLMMEEKNPSKPYLPRKDDPKHLAYPVFQMKGGIPIPPEGPDTAPDPIIFGAK